MNNESGCFGMIRLNSLLHCNLLNSSSWQLLVGLEIAVSVQPSALLCVARVRQRTLTSLLETSFDPNVASLVGSATSSQQSATAVALLLLL